MNLVKMFNEGYSSILRTLGAKPAGPAAPTAPVAPPAPAPADKTKAHTFESKDSKAVEAKQGKAMTEPLNICSLEETMENWKDAGTGVKGNHRVDVPAPKSSKLEAINFLCGPYAKNQNYSHDQQVRVRDFLKEIQDKSDKFDNPLFKKEILFKLADAILDPEKGITDEQMKQIANGDMNADAYIAMVNKTGEPIA